MKQGMSNNRGNHEDSDKFSLINSDITAADTDLLASFAESLSSLDYTTLCIMNHRNKEQGDKPISPDPPKAVQAIAPKNAKNGTNQIGTMSTLQNSNVFGTQTLNSLETMHWQFIDNQNEGVKNLYSGNIVNKVGNIEEKELPMLSAKERRRERNKVLARKTRVKKKQELEFLRDRVMALMQENEKLKVSINMNLPSPIAAETLMKCDIQLPDHVRQVIQQMMQNSEKTKINEISMKQRSFCVVSAAGIDQPIVYASPGFYKLTGYESQHVLGRNCRFLQGPDTDKNEIIKLKNAVIHKQDITVSLLNYHKDGTSFWNKIEIAHLYGKDRATPLIIGLQTKQRVVKRPTIVNEIKPFTTTLNDMKNPIGALSYPTAVIPPLSVNKNTMAALGNLEDLFGTEGSGFDPIAAITATASSISAGGMTSNFPNLPNNTYPQATGLKNKIVSNPVGKFEKMAKYSKTQPGYLLKDERIVKPPYIPQTGLYSVNNMNMLQNPSGKMSLKDTSKMPPKPPLIPLQPLITPRNEELLRLVSQGKPSELKQTSNCSLNTGESGKRKRSRNGNNGSEMTSNESLTNDSMTPDDSSKEEEGNESELRVLSSDE